MRFSWDMQPRHELWVWKRLPPIPRNYPLVSKHFTMGKIHNFFMGVPSKNSMAMFANCWHNQRPEGNIFGKSAVSDIGWIPAWSSWGYEFLGKTMGQNNLHKVGFFWAPIVTMVKKRDKNHGSTACPQVFLVVQHGSTLILLSCFKHPRYKGSKLGNTVKMTLLLSFSQWRGATLSNSSH